MSTRSRQHTRAAPAGALRTVYQQPKQHPENKKALASTSKQETFRESSERILRGAAADEIR